MRFVGIPTSRSRSVLQDQVWLYTVAEGVAAVKELQSRLNGRSRHGAN